MILWVSLGTTTLDNKIKIFSSNEEYAKFNITKTICEAYLITKVAEPSKCCKSIKGVL